MFSLKKRVFIRTIIDTKFQPFIKDLTKYSHMSQLMRNSKSRTESIILHDGTAVLVTHGAQLSKAQGVAILPG